MILVCILNGKQLLNWSLARLEVLQRQDDFLCFALFHPMQPSTVFLPKLGNWLIVKTQGVTDWYLGLGVRSELCDPLSTGRSLQERACSSGLGSVFEVQFCHHPTLCPK